MISALLKRSGSGPDISSCTCHNINRKLVYGEYGYRKAGYSFIIFDFKSPSKDSPNPLTPTEWKSFAGWLVDKRYTPGSLLSEDGINIIESWTDKKITQERLIALLRRGAQMSLALEKWSRAGIWILTRSDPDYPQKLKNRLGTISPPILFGTGNKQLLNIKDSSGWIKRCY